MKVVLSVVMLLGLAVLAGAQVSAPALEVAYERVGNRPDGERSLINVTIKSGGFEITADEADVGGGRREFTLRGNVTVRLSDVCGEEWRSPGNVFRRGCVTARER